MSPPYCFYRVVTQRLNAYLGASPELRQLSGKAGQLLFLQRLYEQVAPASLLSSSHVMQLEQQILTLAANNSAVAAKLRQLAPELAKSLKNRGCEVTGIQVRVQVSFRPATQSPMPVVLSNAGEKRLTELAEQLTDSPLKNALQRLARRVRPKT
jgi:hypothetical protein